VDPAGGFGGFNFAAVARLAPGVTEEEGYAELHALRDRLPEQFPTLFTPEMIEQTGMDVRVGSYLQNVVGDVSTVLWVLMATVGFVLLIACTNVAKLLLVRAEGRSKEIAIRTALGAGRDHLLTQSMTESAVLSVVGALLGVALARVGLGLLLSRGPQDLPRLEQIGTTGPCCSSQPV
jgi:predicted lysophospholipase L1 biosynthesis ABC-type transport system permease subunit